MNKTFIYIDAILLFIFIQFISSVLWIGGSSINGFVFPLAILAVLILNIINKVNIKISFLFLSIVGISLVTSIMIPDASTDGQHYHQPIIYALAAGWNPIYEHHNHIISNLLGQNIWIDHYCKGIETIQASIVACFRNMEIGKASNFIIGISSFFFFDSALASIFSLSIKTRRFFAFTLAFPIIFASQVFSYYIDLYSYYIIAILIASLVWMCKTKDKVHKRWLYCIIGMNVILASSIKLNLLFWLFYFILPFGIYDVFKKKYSDLLTKVIVVTVCIFVSIMTISVNPYITNSIDHHNPIYPLGVNNQKTEYLNYGAQPKFLNDKNRFVQVFCSIFSRPNNNVDMKYAPPIFISKDNLKAIGGVANRIGGAGFFYVEIFILSILLFFYCKKDDYKKYYTFFIFYLLLSYFILPFCSSHRYIPFTYLIPIIATLYIVQHLQKTKWIKFTYKLICVLFVSNVTLPFIASGVFSIGNKIATDFYVTRIKESRHSRILYTQNWSLINKTYGNEVSKVNLDISGASKSNILYKLHFQPLPAFVDPQEVNLKSNNEFIKKYIVRLNGK